MYLKLKVLSQESRLPLHLPHKSCLWGLFGSTWRCVSAQEQRALLQVYERKEPVSCDAQASFVYIDTYMTRDVLYAVWVKFFLAFPTELLEVNLEHTYALTSLEHCSHPGVLRLLQR